MEIMVIDRSSGGDIRSGSGSGRGDIGGTDNVGGKGDRVGAAPTCFGGLIVMPLICPACLVQLLRQ